MKGIYIIPIFLLLAPGCKKTELPTVITKPMTTVFIKSAIGGGGDVVDDGGSIVIEKGACWSTLEYPTINDGRFVDGNGLGEFTFDIDNLISKTKYYVRAYAKNKVGIGYGNQISFITNPPLTPSLTTTPASFINQTTAISGGFIIDDNGAAIVSRGVCWNTSLYPTITDSKTEDGVGSGLFESHLTGLTPKTTYYVRAYAINSEGVGYGNGITFTTQ